MVKTHPVSIATETHGLTGNLLLPESATDKQPVPGAVIIGGPGPSPLQRYSPEGAKQWPVLWTEALGEAGMAGLCYDQRGSGLSSGQYHDADWADLYEDAKAAVETLAIQPEVSKVAAIAWGEGAAYGLKLAAEGKVDGLVLLAPGFYTAEERYGRSIRTLAARRGLSDRVIQLRIGQWQAEIMSAAKRVEQGEVHATTTMGGESVTTNLVRFLQSTAFDPAPFAREVRVPTLLLHGDADTVIPPDESQAMAKAVPGPTDRITYPGVAHFIYRYTGPMRDAAAWLKQVLV